MRVSMDQVEEVNRMSTLIENEEGRQTLTFGAGAIVTLQYKVTCYGPEESEVYPASVSIGTGKTGYAMPIPSAAVAGKLSEMFARLAEQMREAT